VCRTLVNIGTTTTTSTANVQPHTAGQDLASQPRGTSPLLRNSCLRRSSLATGRAAGCRGQPEAETEREREATVGQGSPEERRRKRQQVGGNTIKSVGILRVHELEFCPRCSAWLPLRPQTVARERVEWRRLAASGARNKPLQAATFQAPNARRAALMHWPAARARCLLLCRPTGLAASGCN